MIMTYTNVYRHARCSPQTVGFFEAMDWETVQNALDWLASNIQDSLVMGSQQIIVLHDDAIVLCNF